MKKSILLFCISLTLNASIFTPEAPKSDKKVIDVFRKTASYSTSIIKKGEASHYENYINNTESILGQIKTYDLPASEKMALKKDIVKHTQIMNTVYKNITNKTPNIHEYYVKSLHGLVQFNEMMDSTGYSPLLNEWHDLLKIKHKYMKRPTAKLEKKFIEKWNSVYFVLTDLCLDEELEEPLVEYLNIYKTYFEKLSIVYKNTEYSNIQAIKVLSYKIKSKLEFVSN